MKINPLRRKNRYPKKNERYIIHHLSPNKKMVYEKLKVLGVGTFSKVYECRDTENGEYFAIKQVSKNFLLKHNLREQFTKEVKIHSLMDHPNVVKLYKVFEDNHFIYLLMELCSNDTLEKLIHRRKRLSEVEARFYLKNILEGLRYIHDKNVVHRDMKPANLVISSKMEIKIADFGLASTIVNDRRRRTFCGTPYFIAPEIFDKKKGHSFEVDYWSLGIILYNMIYGCCPFVSDNVEEVYSLIKKGKFYLNDEYGKDINDLIKSLLYGKYQQRADYEFVESSPFLKNISNFPNYLPESTLQTAPTESFLTKFEEPEYDMKKKNIDKIVYKKKDSKYSLHEETLKDNPFGTYEYVKKWVNFSEKFGIGYILNNGIIGIFFNDKTKIVLSNFGITFHYIENSEKETYNIVSFPEKISKKVKLLNYFIKYLKQNSELFKINEDMVDNFVYLHNYKITKYANLFLLSNGFYQMIFKDKTEIHIGSKDDEKIILFIDQKRKREHFLAKDLKEPKILQRLHYVQNFLNNLK